MLIFLSICRDRTTAGGYTTKSPRKFPYAGFSKFGSSDWTRTSDIRINSPPFYRLNYRGIVTTRRIIAKGTAAVKGGYRYPRAFDYNKSNALIYLAIYSKTALEDGR